MVNWIMVSTIVTSASFVLAIIGAKWNMVSIIAAGSIMCVAVAIIGIIYRNWVVKESKACYVSVIACFGRLFSAYIESDGSTSTYANFMTRTRVGVTDGHYRDAPRAEMDDDIELGLRVVAR